MTFTCAFAKPSVDLPTVALGGGSITRRGDTFSPSISLTGRTIGGLETSESL